jgi:hypothetical protein
LQKLGSSTEIVGNSGKRKIVMKKSFFNENVWETREILSLGEWHLHPFSSGTKNVKKTAGIRIVLTSTNDGFCFEDYIGMTSQTSTSTSKTY